MAVKKVKANLSWVELHVLVILEMHKSMMRSNFLSRQLLHQRERTAFLLGVVPGHMSVLEVSGCGSVSISVQQEAGQICLQDKEPNGKCSGHPGSTMGSVCLDICLSLLKQLPKLL